MLLSSLCSLRPNEKAARSKPMLLQTASQPRISYRCLPKAGSMGSPNAPEVISFAPSLGAGKGLRLLPRFLSPDRLQAREKPHRLIKTSFHSGYDMLLKWLCTATWRAQGLLPLNPLHGQVSL